MITFTALTNANSVDYIEIVDATNPATVNIEIPADVFLKNDRDVTLTIYVDGLSYYQCRFDQISLPAGIPSVQMLALNNMFMITVTAPVTVTGEVEIKNDSGNPIPVSASTLPLPTGASTSANQATEITALTAIGATLTSIDTGIPVSIGQAVMADSMPVTIASNQSTLGVSVSNAITISGTVPVSASALPLPTGASTSANQTTIITKLTNIDGGTPNTLGQATMVNSMSVVIASNQSAIPVTGATTSATNFGNDRSVDNGATVLFSAIGTKYAMLGLDLNTTTGVNLSDISTYFGTADRLIIEVILDPTVAGVFTYAAIANSNCQLAIGGVTNTITGGTTLYQTLISGKDSLTQFTRISHLNKIVQSGTTKIVIAVTPLVASVNVRGLLNFKENV